MKVNRRGRRIHIDDPFVSIVGNLPPAVLGELSDRNSKEDGCLARILFRYPEPIQQSWTESEPDSQTFDEYEKPFANLLTLKFYHASGSFPILTVAALSRFQQSRHVDPVRFCFSTPYKLCKETIHTKSAQNRCPFIFEEMNGH